MKLGKIIKGDSKLVGRIGEDLASKFLQNKGYIILDRNFLKKWGEIDIVARGTDGKLHFIEVKTVSYETKSRLKQAIENKTWRPEENVHNKKIQRLNRAIESWLMGHRDESEWQIDVLAVRIVSREKYGTIKFLPNIIID